MTREQAEEIARDAVKDLGRDWDALPAHSREIYIEAARNGELWLKRQESEESEEAGQIEAEDQPKTTKRGKK